MRIHKSDMNNFPRFTYDDKGYYCDKTVFFISGKNLKYLLGFLNSNIFKFLLPKYVSAWDDSGFMLQKIFLDNIPILDPDPELKKHIEEIVDSLLDEVKTCDYKRIDQILYNIAGFNEEEITYIESI